MQVLVFTASGGCGHQGRVSDQQPKRHFSLYPHQPREICGQNTRDEFCAWSLPNPVQPARLCRRWRYRLPVLEPWMDFCVRPTRPWLSLDVKPDSFNIPGHLKGAAAKPAIGRNMAGITATLPQHAGLPKEREERATSCISCISY